MLSVAHAGYSALNMMHFSTLVLALLLSVASVGAHGQPIRPVPKVGYLGFPGEPTEGSQHRDAFMAGLRDLGYIPGKGVIVEVRLYSTEVQLRQALAEFISLKTDVIFVGSPFAAMAAKQMRLDIPIVCGSCGDPVENGLVASLARPGGNVTGLASLSAELIGKRIELMKELFPRKSRFAVFVFPTNPGFQATLRALDTAGRAIGVELKRFDIRSASDFENAFRLAAAGRTSAVILQDDPLTRSSRGQIAALSLKHRLPVSTGVPEVAEAGALVAYGPDRVQMARRAASFTDRIIKGAKPADLPFEQAATFELILNRKTVEALGLSIPQQFMMRVDRVIE